MDEAVTLPPAGMNAGAHVEQLEHSRTHEWRTAGVPRLVPRGLVFLYGLGRGPSTQ